MPPVRAYLTAELTTTRAVRLDMYCGVDAQSESVFEGEHEANVPQTKIALLDKTVETGRMKISLSRGDLAQNERTAISAWQTFYYDELHSRAATDRATTASVPGYGQHPALEPDDDADDGSDGDSDAEDTISISSMEACCSTTSEFIGSDIDKQGLLNAPWTHDKVSYAPAKLDFPRSHMPLTEICPICEIEDSDEIQAMITPCCGRFVHELCNDEQLEETSKCWNCKKEQKSSTSSTAWTCSKADEYIVHFAARPEGILENASSDSCTATPEQCPSLASSASGETDSWGADAFNDISPYSYTQSYLEPEENKALEYLESLKDSFLGLWTEVADMVTESDKIRIIQGVVTGTKVPVDFHIAKPMVPSPAISSQPPGDSESATICENQSLQERSHAFGQLQTSLESAMNAMRDLISRDPR